MQCLLCETTFIFSGTVYFVSTVYFVQHIIFISLLVYLLVRGVRSGLFIIVSNVLPDIAFTLIMTIAIMIFYYC